VRRRAGSAAAADSFLPRPHSSPIALNVPAFENDRLPNFLACQLPAATDVRGHGSQTFVEESETDASCHGLAARVGIVDQIDDHEHGLLVHESTDLAAFGAAVEALIRDRSEAARLAANACGRAVNEFLGDRHLEQYGRLFEQLATDLA
jgi:glycosyltransferase involved in cell wall biosynthesis